MPQFDLSTSVEEIGLLGSSSVTLTNVAGSTVYYDYQPTPSASTNAGSLTAGQAVTLTQPAWIVSASRSTVQTVFATAQDASSDGSQPFVGNISSQVAIDLCRPWSIYSPVSPGSDVTTAIQNAIAYIVANYPNGGDIYFSKPGTYTINGAPQTGTAQSYSYNGQILFPAVAEANQLAIRIRGMIEPNGGGSTTGAPTGVILQSNATSGYVFDMIPAFTQFGKPWTAIMPIFENIIVRCSNNPTCGGINVSCTQRAKLQRTIIDIPTAFTYPTSGSLEALVLPQHFNNGDVTVRDCTIRGYPTAIRMSEHAVLDNVDVSYCMTAFAFIDGGHDNWFGYVDVEEVLTVFSVTGTGIAAVYGHIDFENTNTTGASTPSVFANVANGAALAGSIAFNIDPNSGGLGVVGAGFTGALEVNNIAQGRGPSSAMHPADSFKRLNNLAYSSLTAGAPGQCWPTLHSWRTLPGGGWALSTGGLLTATTTGSYALVPAIQSGKPRRLSTTINLPASYDVALVASRTYNSSSTGLWARLHLGNLTFGTGFVSQTLLATASGVVTGSSTVTLAMEIYYQAGLAYLVKVFLNGTLQVSWALTAAQQSLVAPGTTAPNLEDGIWANETSSAFTAFQVSELTPIPPVAGATVTLTAGTSGSIANTAITASSVIRVFNVSAGGTVGALSVTLSAGVGFTINSTSGTDTSKVYYEIVSY